MRVSSQIVNVELILAQIRPEGVHCVRCQATELIRGFQERSYGSVARLAVGDNAMRVIEYARGAALPAKSLADSGVQYIYCGILPDMGGFHIEIFLPKERKIVTIWANLSGEQE